MKRRLFVMMGDSLALVQYDSSWKIIQQHLFRIKPAAAAELNARAFVGRSKVNWSNGFGI